MRHRIVIATLAVTTLVAGGTALATRGGPFHDDPAQHRQELAQDLARNLDGVTAAEVETALEKVRAQRMAEHRAELAKDLASRLEGVTAAQVESALEKAWRERRSSDGPPDHQAFAKTLASELDKTEAEVRTALHDARRARMNDRLDAAVRAGRLTEAQADRIREHMRSARGWRHGGPRPGMGDRGPYGTEDRLAGRDRSERLQAGRRYEDG